RPIVSVTGRRPAPALVENSGLLEPPTLVQRVEEDPPEPETLVQRVEEEAPTAVQRVDRNGTPAPGRVAAVPGAGRAPVVPVQRQTRTGVAPPPAPPAFSARPAPQPPEPIEEIIPESAPP